MLADRHRRLVDQVLEVPDEDDFTPSSATGTGVAHLEPPAPRSVRRVFAELHQLRVLQLDLATFGQDEPSVRIEHFA